MTLDITGTDMFCGAGGFTTGAVAAGVTIKMAMNHWKRAIATHNENYPQVRHHLADISQANPRFYPRTTILVASPECTNHSIAKGKKKQESQGEQATLWDPAKPPMPEDERSRCTMWDPLRFAEYHRYEAVILENVVDARKWVMWDAWLAAWKALGYRCEIVYFNSQFAPPTPQSRDRMYCVFTRERNPRPSLTFSLPAYCAYCEQACQAVQSWKQINKPYGKYGQRSGQYVYRCPRCTEVVHPQFTPAAYAINWSLPIQRIGDRKKPLKEKTMKRIAYGLKKFARVTSTPLVMSLSHRSKSVIPVGVQAMPTQTTNDNVALITPPFLMDHLGEYRPRSIDGSFSTICAEGNHHSLIVPPPMAWMMSYYNNGSMVPVHREAIGTVTTIDRHALVTADMSTVNIHDCGFRMLEPEEIQAAMAFPPEYVVTGNRREKVKQLGNACTPPVITMIMERVVDTLK